MNWKRGFVRMWLAASAIWLVITGVAFSLPHSLIDVISWREPNQKPHASSVGPTSGFVPGESQASSRQTPNREDLLAEAYRRGLLPPDMRAYYEEALRRGLLAHPTGAREGPPARPVLDKPPAPIKVYELEAHTITTANLQSFAIFGLMPPVLALALGIIVWWIQSGFRPSTSRVDRSGNTP